ncbi:longevity assurance proteins LAG1/LAC1 [Sporormia fimetaria CBS 119925]|uniref:Longevity assurance proteins LAG1/LAC1 n=1 Tax=Sporormia fimetaria CBS 119925 TaxID=1340428 RepID=A0A6A6UZW4_9PLEO|nr:longevity assurance proteins LAG1/LAC1 [Sporormia fimetaria CBS 119925]
MFFPRARRRTSKFFHLSYHNPDNELYGHGPDDLQLVLLWIVIFTAMRVLVMEYLLDPIARYNGIRTRKGLVRFKEQAWLVMYCTCSWSLGMYIMYHSQFWFNLNGLWKDWPIRETTGLHKWYYIVQWAFYVQQIIVVNIEEKRKDYVQMFTHHIFTCALIFLSYGYYQMRVGTMILCIMDIVDIVLPSAKLFKYLGYTSACDFTSIIFAITWFVTRHVFYPMVIWSVYKHTPTTMVPGCHLNDGSVIPPSDPRFEEQGGNQLWSNILQSYINRDGPVCWSPALRHSFLFLLIALQLIICLWSITIAKIIWKVAIGENAEDARSGDEGGDTEDEIDMELANVTHPINGIKSSHDLPAIEEEVGVDALSYKCRKRTSSTRTTSRSSGISISGHGDKKELLGRIGCDKPV